MCVCVSEYVCVCVCIGVYYSGCVSLTTKGSGGTAPHLQWEAQSVLL